VFIIEIIDLRKSNDPSFAQCVVITHNLKQIFATMKEILSILFLSLICWASAAQVPIKGTVVDDQNIPSRCSVLVKNTFRGTMTDVDGTYTLSALPTDTLVFSMVGTVSQEIVVGNRT